MEKNNLKTENMKNYFTIALLLIWGISNTQNRKEEFFFTNVLIDPTATIKEQSPNLVAEVGLVSGIKQIKAGVQILYGLEGGYIDLTGTIGVNIPIDFWKRLRVSSGVRLGVIKRGYKDSKTYTYPLFGVEGNVSYMLTDNFGLIFRTTYDRREDFLYSGAEPSNRLSNYGGLIVKF